MIFHFLIVKVHFVSGNFISLYCTYTELMRGIELGEP